MAFGSTVPLGTDAVFHHRPTPSAKAVFAAGLQVRVFALSGSESRPTRISTVADCDVFLSAVYKLAPAPNGGLRLALFDQGWINVSSSGSSARDGRWFLVFEEVGASQEEFRIRSADANNYFATGFAITVTDTGAVPFAQIKAEYERREGEGARLLREVDLKNPRIPCYGYRPVQVTESDEETLVATAESCRPDQWPPSM